MKNPVLSWWLSFFAYTLYVTLCSRALAASDEVALTLERTVCYGTCPVYRVSVDHKGKVEFEGINYVCSLEKHQSQISVDLVQSLVKELLELGFFELPQRTGDAVLKCEFMATDSPSVIVSLRRGAQFNSVSDDHGCRGNKVLEKLRLVEERIDQVLATEKWIGKCPERTKDRARINTAGM